MLPPGYEPFMREICANPEDDTVRLVYADWLDENGDPDRAEFIRWQIASNVAGKNHKSRHAKQHLKANYAKRRAELPELPAIDWAAFERGFVNRVTVRADTRFPASLATALTLAPITQLLLARCLPWVIPQLVNVPGFSQVRGIEANSGYVDDAALVSLAQSPNVTGLGMVKFRGETWGTTRNGRERIPQITDRGAEALANSPYLTRLRILTLSSTHITPKGWAILKERYSFAYINGAEISGA